MISLFNLLFSSFEKFSLSLKTEHPEVKVRNTIEENVLIRLLKICFFILKIISENN